MNARRRARIDLQRYAKILGYHTDESGVGGKKSFIA